MLCPSYRAPIIGALLAYFLIVLILTSSNFQVSSGSRRFLTGLIIGTLLARNGMPAYPGPASPPHYLPSHQHHQQQPLFIIIPSASGKSYKPQVVAPYANMYSPPPLDYHGHSNRRSLFRSIRPKEKSNKMASSSNGNNKNNNSQTFTMASGGAGIPIRNPNSIRSSIERNVYQ